MSFAEGMKKNEAYKNVMEAINWLDRKQLVEIKMLIELRIESLTKAKKTQAPKA